MKKFNTTAVCIPSKHYMVDLSDRVREIEKMVDAGEYLTINRARQYGKTTTLLALKKHLEGRYEVVSLDFQKIGSASFQSEEVFVSDFCKLVLSRRSTGLKLPDTISGWMERIADDPRDTARLIDLSEVIARWCRESDRDIVLVIDEVDSGVNNQVFLDFLAQLREAYISRESYGTPALKSVILAGVEDIKHLKRRIRDEDDAKQNSPWNIAADFNIDMSLSEEGIEGMLNEYEKDHHTGMDTDEMAREIRDYTEGYPFLVSRICQLIDEKVQTQMNPGEAWSRRGLDEAIKVLLAENNTLFQSLTKNLNNMPELKASIRRILIGGARIPYNAQQDELVRMQMYGLIRNDQNNVRVSNRIFETLLYNLFLSDEEMKADVFSLKGDMAKNLFVKNGQLDMCMVLERFIETFTEVFGPLQERFKEKDGRELFLLYLKPIINGTGNYYIEAQTRDQTRTDVIVDYLGQRYIVELKIWHGERYNEAGEKQIAGYLDYFGLTTGYMLSFNFNKNKEQGIKRIEYGEKVLIEGIL